MAFDLSQYETVHDRLKRFWSENSEGRIYTELIAYSDTQYIFKASIYKKADDPYPLATGFAEERVGSTFVNKTSAAENAETSAIGRALSNANYVSQGKERASVEEMKKANRYEVANGDVPREAWKNSPRGEWADEGKASDKQIGFVTGIVRDAFKSTGLQDDEKSWNYIGEWLNRSEWAQKNKPINKAEDLDKKEASIIINDKMKNKSITKLVEFLQTKQPADFDPWKSPANF